MATPPPSATKRYFCFTEEKVEGPFILVELAGLLHGKHIDGDTPVCLEGSDEWLYFKDRSEYGYAREIPVDAVNRHVEEQTHANASDWSPKKLLPFLGVMSPVFLYLLYWLARRYLAYHLQHGF